jgi:hypothetical protein
MSRAPFVLAAICLLGIGEIALAQTEQPSAATKTGKERTVSAAETPAPSKDKKFSMCLETWDAQTHMTKREWRVACLRSIKDYPDAFDR